jgi:hypothetical protein
MLVGPSDAVDLFGTERVDVELHCLAAAAH